MNEEQVKEVSNRVNIIKGDLIKLSKEGSFDVIIHGANCKNIMGKGIAKQIRENYFSAYLKDQLYYFMHNIETYNSMLGTFTVAEIDMKLHNYPFEPLRDKLYVINLYTQFDIGANFNFFAFKNGMHKIDSTFNNCSIGLPWIGCGIGGFKDKTAILNVIKELKNNFYYIVELE